MTSAPHLDAASALSLPRPCGCAPLLPAPGAVRLDDWAALLEAVTVRLQRLVDDGDIATHGATGDEDPLQDCIDALRQLQRNLHAGGQ